MRLKGFSTKVLHTAYNKKDAHNSLHMPIYSNAAFEFESSEQMELAFQGRVPDHSYSRISNPTVENLEERIKSITGAQAVTAVSSGMAAISNTLITLAQSSSNIITTNYLFGNTLSLFQSTLNSLGIEARFCDLINLEEVEKNIDSNTVAIFFETITNPQLSVPDIGKLAAIAQKHKIALIADSTLTPPNIFNAGKSGINIEIISGTKIISGGATTTGGLIIDYGNFNWDDNVKLAEDARKFGPLAFTSKLRREIHRNLGACLSPHSAYLQSIGLETLSLRYDKAATNCRDLASILERQPLIQSVNYPGFESSPHYETARRYFGEFPCAVFTFELETREKCFKFLNSLQLLKRATNLYDNRTLIIHPASTIFWSFSPLQRASYAIPDTLIRVSAGIEDLDDLKNDIFQALEKI